MALAQARAAILEDVQERLLVIAAGHGAAAMADTYEALARDFEALACCALLLHADTERFHRDLVWAGLTRRRFLDRCIDEANLQDRHRARSRCRGFLCALAAGDLALAREIGDRSPDDWTPDGEYEDDFAYHLVLHRLLSGAEPSATRAAMRRLEATCGGASAELDVSAGLCNRDDQAFHGSLLALLASRRRRIDGERVVFADDETFAPCGAVCIEGLGLLRLADHLGLSLARSEYPNCPSMVRRTRSQQRPVDVVLEAERVSRSPV